MNEFEEPQSMDVRRHAGLHPLAAIQAPLVSTQGGMMRFLLICTVAAVLIDAVAEAGPGRRSRRSMPVMMAPRPVASRPVQAQPVAQVQRAVQVQPVAQAQPAVQAQPKVQAASHSPVQETSSVDEVDSRVTPENIGDDALAEVNAARARRGLRPFLPDPLLNQAARTCAQLRATSRIRGHLANDFAHLPAGASASSAGCGALEPSWGWGTCCTYENYTYAGAAWVMGADGRRYMHLFVR